MGKLKGWSGGDIELGLGPGSLLLEPDSVTWVLPFSLVWSSPLGAGPQPRWTKTGGPAFCALNGGSDL